MDSLLVEHVLHTGMNEENGQETAHFVGIWNEQVISMLVSFTKISHFSLRGKNGLGIPKQPCRKQALQWIGPRHDEDVICSASFLEWFPISHGRSTVQRQLAPLSQEEHGSHAQVTWVTHSSSLWEQAQQLKPKQHYTLEVITKGCKGVIRNIRTDTAMECTDTVSLRGRRPWKAQTI